MRGRAYIRKACAVLRSALCARRFSDKLVGRNGNDIVAARQFEWLRDSEDRKKRQTRHLTTKRSFSFLNLCAHVHIFLNLLHCSHQCSNCVSDIISMYGLSHLTHGAL